MNEAPIHIVTNFAKLPENPKVTIWHWIKYYAFNLYRKPLVWKRQKELKSLFVEVKASLDKTILPQLWERRIYCPECRDAYGILKPQEFMSQLASILNALSKDKAHPHWIVFDSFKTNKQSDFDKSEEISAWINGFR